MVACYAPDAHVLRSGVPASRRRGRRPRCGGCSARAARISRVVASDIEADDADRPRALGRDVHVFGDRAPRREPRSTRRSRFATAGSSRHVDRFDLWRWLRQALGRKGALLGWLPPVQRAVRAQAAKALADWRAKNAPALIARVDRPLDASRRRAFLAEPTFEHDRPRRVGVAAREPRHAGRADAGGGAALSRGVPVRSARRRDSAARSGSRSCTASCCACGRRGRRRNTR